MIDKNLFIIWIGDNYPGWLENSVEAYRIINPTFNLNHIKITGQILKSSYLNSNIEDSDIYIKCLKMTIKYINISILKECLKTDSQQTNNNQFSIKRRKYIQILSNMFRHDLLHSFGGIYVDADTFPIKSFDDMLLNNDSFLVESPYWAKPGFTTTDNYFYGLKKGYTYQLAKTGPKLWPQRIFEEYDDVMKNSDLNNSRKIARQKFFDGTLKIGETSLPSKYFYIEHFYDGRWQFKKNMIDDTIFDIIFNEIYETKMISDKIYNLIDANNLNYLIDEFNKIKHQAI